MIISPYEHIEGNCTMLTLGVIKHSQVDKMSDCKLQNVYGTYDFV